MSYEDELDKPDHVPGEYVEELKAPALPDETPPVETPPVESTFDPDDTAEPPIEPDVPDGDAGPEGEP